MNIQLYIIGVISADGDELYLDAGLTADEVETWLEQQGNPSLEDFDHDEGWQIYSVDSYPDCSVNICRQSDC